MATFDDVARLVRVLPRTDEVDSRGWRTWRVQGRMFVWERPFTKADLRRFGDDPVPSGPILAAAVEDLGEKEAVLDAHPEAFFSIPHLNRYAAFLIRLDVVDRDVLAEAIEDAWLARAPRKVAAAYRRRQGADG